MPLVTPQDLYARLREVFGSSSDERLARELDLGLKTVQRLKAGHGVEFDTTIRLLQAAGWLAVDGAATTRADLDQIERGLEQLVAALEQSRDRRRGHGRA